MKNRSIQTTAQTQAHTEKPKIVQQLFIHMLISSTYKQTWQFDCIWSGWLWKWQHGSRTKLIPGAGIYLIHSNMNRHTFLHTKTDKQWQLATLSVIVQIQIGRIRTHPHPSTTHVQPRTVRRTTENDILLLNYALHKTILFKFDNYFMRIWINSIEYNLRAEANCVASKMSRNKWEMPYRDLISWTALLDRMIIDAFHLLRPSERVCVGGGRRGGGGG